MDDFIKKLASKYAEQIEELTQEQFEDALYGAIQSGDFVKHVSGFYPDQKQGMSYIPFRRKDYLEMKVNKLKRLLFLTDEAVSFVEMNDLTSAQIEAFYKAFPEEKPE